MFFRFNKAVVCFAVSPHPSQLPGSKASSVRGFSPAAKPH